MNHAMNESVRVFLGIAALMCALHNAAAIPFNPEFKRAPKCVREYSLAVKDAALGGEHSVLLLENGSLRCTGWNGDGECEPPPGLTGTVQVVAGNRFSAARNAAGKVTTWGKAPVWPEGRTARWIVADNETLGAVLDDGSLWSNSTGILVMFRPMWSARWPLLEAGSIRQPWLLREDCVCGATTLSPQLTRRHSSASPPGTMSPPA